MISINMRQVAQGALNLFFHSTTSTRELLGEPMANVFKAVIQCVLRSRIEFPVAAFKALNSNMAVARNEKNPRTV